MWIFLRFTFPDFCVTLKLNLNEEDKMFNKSDMIHEVLVSACVGCNKIDGDICIAYAKPHMKHRLGVCPLKSTNIIENGTKAKKFVNPLKASKRKRR